MIPKKVLQFITDGSTVEQTVRQVREVLDGGCRWIQVRMKDFDDKDIQEALKRIVPMCRRAEAVCIMNDRVDMAYDFKLDGVHLGADDMPIEEARQILGQDAIIGVTANTIEQVILLSQRPMSYFGLGPMRFTSTKKNLSPLIGLDGYHNLMEGMKETGVTKPAVAVGGIRLEDVFDLLDLGLWGVAVSGAIACAESPRDSTRKFMDQIDRFIQ